VRSGRNVTINPVGPANAVQAPQIKQVLSLRTGKVLEARRFIARHRHEDLVRTRSHVLEAIYAGKPRLVCAVCQVPVYLVASPIKAFFFRHRTEDGSCPAVTRSFETEEEVRARQYAGVQESDAHRRLKRLLLRSMQADPAFTELAEEQTWRRADGIAGLRRPDVSAAFGDLRLAFEAQLSTTFLSVVVGRRAFYRSQGGLLVWVLASFDPHNRRMTEDDIVFPNNSNVLVIDDETAAASEASGRFMAKCWYRRPDGAAPAAIWACELVGFDQLTLDLEGQRAFLIDVEGLETTRRAQLETERREAIDSAHTKLRDEFLVYWGQPFDPAMSYIEHGEIWSRFGERFAALGLGLPEYYHGDQQLDRRIKVILTAKTGQPVGWGYKKLPEVAHHLHDKHPELLLLFGHLLRLYSHDQVLKDQDKTGAWGRKTTQLRQEIRQGSQRYAPDASWSDLLVFLFPEAAGLVRPEQADQAA
jgi:hypothetical protein